MLATLCEFASDDTAIHLSLAGGRKTMSYYAGQAMNLVARPQDRLSHVILSDKRFEFSPDFSFRPRCRWCWSCATGQPAMWKRCRPPT